MPSLGARRSRPLLRLSLAAGFFGYAYYSYRNYREAVARQSIYKVSPYKVVLYRALPLGCLTSFAGRLAALPVPGWLRGPLYGTFARFYNCDMEESAGDLRSFSTFNEFFTRVLKPGIRPIDGEASMVSPADGKILAYGKLDFADRPGDDDMFPEQIKGVRYPLRTFLGQAHEDVDMRPGKGSSWYYCTIYLAPGSYHRFHCPVDDFRVSSIQRIPGEVLPVAPWLMSLVPGLVSLNERAIIAGTWGRGRRRMFMVPVGATNVRSIKLRWPIDICHPKECLQKGDEVGRFEMGSLVALVFEGPPDFAFSPQLEDTWIKYGQALGRDAHKPSGLLRWW